MRVKKEKDGLYILTKSMQQKIPVEWYSWMHFTQNKIEKNHDLKKT